MVAVGHIETRERGVSLPGSINAGLMVATECDHPARRVGARRRVHRRGRAAVVAQEFAADEHAPANPATPIAPPRNMVRRSSFISISSEDYAVAEQSSV
jgi:hypothetical protein